MRHVSLDAIVDPWLRAEKAGGSSLARRQFAFVRQPSIVLDRVAEVAARLFSAPIGFLHLRDSRLRWIRPGIAVSAGWSEKDIMLDAQAFAGDEIGVVSDLGIDERFRDNPLVTRTNGFRACAVVPVPGPRGETLGTLCILDLRPRQWDEETLSFLRRLSELTGDILASWVSSLTLESDPLEPPAPEQRYRELFENSTDIVYTHDLHGRITAINWAAERLLGYTKEELVGTDIADLVSPEHAERARQMLLEQVGGGIPMDYKLKFRVKDGREIQLDVSAHLLFAHGQPMGLMGFGRDVSPVNLLHHHAGSADNQNLPDVLGELRRLITKSYQNRDEMFADFLKTGCEVLGMPTGIFAEIDHDSCIVRAVHGCADQVQVGETHPLESTRLRQVAIDGKTLVSEARRIRSKAPFFLARGSDYLVCAPVVEGGRVRALLAFTASDPRFSLSSQMKDALEVMAGALGRRDLDLHGRDGRTTLLSAQGVMEVLRNHIEIARAERSQFGVAILDIDWLRLSNGQLDPMAEERLSRLISERLSRSLYPHEVAGTMGSNRYLVVFPSPGDCRQVDLRVQSLLETVRSPYRLESADALVTTSAGLSIFPESGFDAPSLVSNAEGALFKAKQNGRNTVGFSTDGEWQSVSELLELEASLHRAIEKGQFSLRFERLIDMEGSLDSLEVLLAWSHPSRGMMRANQYIPIAEAAGVIVPIGAWVLREACRQNVLWQKKGHAPLTLAVNVSAVQFARADFTETVASILDQTGLNARFLELEITESAVMRDIHRSIITMTELRELGVRLSIDDFGTGHSSLSYIQRLPANTLKIDRCFLAGQPDTVLPLLRAIVSLAHTVELNVVAEGVESLDQFDLARKAGCDRVQGYLFGRALSAKEAGRLLMARRRGPLWRPFR